MEQKERRLQAIDYLTQKCTDFCLPNTQDVFKLIMFGSYRLQVHFPQTDIDAICVFR